ncbi:Rho GTPase-activating protein 42 [Batrachochytrium dendrobatidis]|nr:Rho GTPase-activating protein 42 [Batrachochytrium dendrobatidis]
MRAVALYSCTAEDPSELSFEVGDLILDVRPTDEEGWFTGRLEKSGLRGNLPGNFVRFREDPPGPPLRAQFNDQKNWAASSGSATSISGTAVFGEALSPLPKSPSLSRKLDPQATRKELLEKSSSLVQQAKDRPGSMIGLLSQNTSLGPNKCRNISSSGSISSQPSAIQSNFSIPNPAIASMVNSNASQQTNNFGVQQNGFEDNFQSTSLPQMNQNNQTAPPVLPARTPHYGSGDIKKAQPMMPPRRPSQSNTSHLSFPNTPSLVADGAKSQDPSLKSAIASLKKTGVLSSIPQGTANAQNIFAPANTATQNHSTSTLTTSSSLDYGKLKMVGVVSGEVNRRDNIPPPPQKPASLSCSSSGSSIDSFSTPNSAPIRPLKPSELRGSLNVTSSSTFKSTLSNLVYPSNIQPTTAQTIPLGTKPSAFSSPGGYSSTIQSAANGYDNATDSSAIAPIRLNQTSTQSISTNQPTPSTTTNILGGSIAARLAALSVSTGQSLQPVSPTIRRPSASYSSSSNAIPSQIQATQPLVQQHNSVLPIYSSSAASTQPPYTFTAKTAIAPAEINSADKTTYGSKMLSAEPKKAPPLPSRSSNITTLQRSVNDTSNAVPKPISTELFDRYADAFIKADTANLGVLNPTVVQNIWLRSYLSLSQLSSIWNLVKVDKLIHGLTLHQFVIGMFLIDDQLKGNPLPTSLPENVILFIQSCQQPNSSKSEFQKADPFVSIKSY